MADYSQVNYITQPVLTPRERDFEKRITELEQVVSKIAKTIFYDDSMTETTLPFVTYTDAPDAVLELKDARIMELERANLQLRESVAAKDKEIERLMEVIVRQDDEIFDLAEILKSVRQAMKTDAELP